MFSTEENGGAFSFSWSVTNGRFFSGNRVGGNEEYETEGCEEKTNSCCDMVEGGEGGIDLCVL